MDIKTKNKKQKTKNKKSSLKHTFLSFIGNDKNFQKGNTKLEISMIKFKKIYKYYISYLYN